ncbi:MAG: HEPN domain-containing protein [Candidatus Micrarchaeota archaeon]
MSLEKLLEEGVIEAIEPTRELVENALSAAEKDLATARTVLETDNFDWTLAIAYNAMLQAGRALVFSEGYRATGVEAHKTVVRFCAEKLVRESGFLVKLFDKMRVRRHRVIYEERGTVSKSEAEDAVRKAEEFVGVVKEKLKARL